jgi:hypothetical protein
LQKLNCAKSRRRAHVGTAAPGCPAKQSSASSSAAGIRFDSSTSRAWPGRTAGGGCPHILAEQWPVPAFGPWPSRHSLNLIVLSQGDPAHAEWRYRGVAAVVGPHVAAEEAERSVAAAASVSEPLHAAVAVDEARFADATRTADGRSADANCPASSSMAATRSAED